MPSSYIDSFDPSRIHQTLTLILQLSSTQFIYQLKVDYLRHFEWHIGGVINPVKPRADEWYCIVPASVQ